MKEVLIYSLVSAFIISLISFIGVFFLAIKPKKLDKILILLVGFAAGGLLGGALIHLIPESFSKIGSVVFLYVLIGFLLFFVIERYLHWRHCHKGKCDVHMFTYMSLIGDGVHNFIDGLIIAGSFLISFELGIVSSVAILLHEIPQEIGDFGVLIYGGFSKLKALVFNFLSALLAIVGVIVGYYLGFSNFLPGFAAGGFLYIALMDLGPELRKDKKSIIFVVLGVLLMIIFKFLFPS